MVMYLPMELLPSNDSWYNENFDVAVMAALYKLVMRGAA